LCGIVHIKSIFAETSIKVTKVGDVKPINAIIFPVVTWAVVDIDTTTIYVK
jgi:hypothetical protein